MRGLTIVLVGCVAALLAAAGALARAESRAGDEPGLPRVTLVGDSIAAALGQCPDAQTILAEGIELRLELAPCRRVGQDSCPYRGERPPNLIRLVEALGPALGPTVIVSVGYNDYEDQYAANIEEALGALRRAGVVHVLWATLRAARHPYLTMNDAIEAAAARHSELTVVDWNVYSRSHPDWFQQDGLHLGYDGAVAMATLFHSALEKLGIPAEPRRLPVAALQVTTRRLPPAVSGKPYSVRLTARGGRPPYRWARAAPFPPWLRLTQGGRLAGTARARPATLVVAVRVTDASGASASRRLALRVEGSTGSS